MSHLYGTVDGMAQTAASRRGSKGSGLTTHAAGWKGAVRVDVWFDEEAGVDRFFVALVPWQGSGGGRRQLAEGILDSAAAPEYEIQGLQAEEDPR